MGVAKRRDQALAARSAATAGKFEAPNKDVKSQSPMFSIT
jgi:hypothetical protein